MNKRKSSVTIRYLSGEDYRVDNVKRYWFEGIGVSRNNLKFEGGILTVVDDQSIPYAIDHEDSKLCIEYYDKKRKTEVIEKIPTRDIEWIFQRDREGMSHKFTRLHRKGVDKHRITIVA